MTGMCQPCRIYGVLRIDRSEPKVSFFRESWTVLNACLHVHIVWMLLRASKYLQLSGSTLQKAIGYSPEDAGHTPPELASYEGTAWTDRKPGGGHTVFNDAIVCIQGMSFFYLKHLGIFLSKHKGSSLEGGASFSQRLQQYINQWLPDIVPRFIKLS